MSAVSRTPFEAGDPKGAGPRARPQRARPGGGGWAPTAGRSSPPTGYAGNGARPGPTIGGSAQRGSSAWPDRVEGQARGIQSRTEPRGRKRQDQVWTFRIERYDDLGNQIAVVPVEMRGRAFAGSLGEGDWVRAGGLAQGGNLRTRRIENVTTGSVVRAKRHWTGLKALVVLTVLAVLAVMALQLVSTVATDDDQGSDESPVVVEPIPMP